MCSIPVIHGEYSKMGKLVREFVEEHIKLCQPKDLWIIDGSEEEEKQLVKILEDAGAVKKLPKYKNCYLALTDPADVARVENRTVMVTKKKEDAVPTPKEGVAGALNIWMSPEEYHKMFLERWTGCMQGRTMYVIPFSMGPVGGPLSKNGIQITDSPYVVLAMKIMTRMTYKVLEHIGDGKFVPCLHSLGNPIVNGKPVRPVVNGWPCDPERVLIGHFPDTYLMHSYGSGYGGNSLMGKKCFALRIGCNIARDEGWLAEHMLISRVTMPNGKSHCITAAFPSACGKTNLAMMTPTIPGYKVHCIGDDICWMRFDEEGVLRAINPEAGFFGVAPGTSYESNPMAMDTCMANTIFTNVAETSDGGVWWEGQPLPPAGITIKDWHGNPWTPDCGRTAAHPNSRFACPASQCPIIDPAWEDPKGVPIDAIIFGGRRPEGVPLVYESYDWQHGVFVGTTMRSETTFAAQDLTKKVVRNDPFAMKPFFGYNLGNYIRHWLSFGKKKGLKLPRIYHVNWFRKDSKTGEFLWPGYGENSRAIAWICKRLEGEDCAVPTPIGYVPKPDSIDLTGLGKVDMEQLLSVPKDFWTQEVENFKTFFDEQLPQDTPDEMKEELQKLRKRVQESK